MKLLFKDAFLRGRNYLADNQYYCLLSHCKGNKCKF